jgi:uncharacterized LabA/DUF88 family protein
MKPNYAFIDGQNLYLGTAKAELDPWMIDLARFKVYLKDKYKISRIYYFLGYVHDDNASLYTRLQELGYIVVFKKQIYEMKSTKKWNIDSDLIFRVMEKLIDEPDEFDKILLVSWDGDFKILVDYLIKKDRFLKILLPNKKFASSLYKELDILYRDFLLNVRPKIEHKKRGFLKH